MAVSVASFKVAFPSFAYAGDMLIAAQLANAEAITGDGYNGEAKRDLAVMLATAHALALEPMGRDAGLVDKRGETTYSAQLRELKRGNACLHTSRMGTLDYEPEAL